MSSDEVIDSPVGHWTGLCLKEFTDLSLSLSLSCDETNSNTIMSNPRLCRLDPMTSYDSSDGCREGKGSAKRTCFGRIDGLYVQMQKSLGKTRT